MAKKEAPLEFLENYLPGESASIIFKYLHEHRVHLTITRGRKSILGDYRHSTQNRNHRISVNGNLNKFAFLITLIHELAHLLTFMEHGNRVAAHGREWKGMYRRMLAEFLQLEIFPQDIVDALKKSIHDMAASSCSDEALTRTLRAYDSGPRHSVFVEELEEGRLFSLDNGQVFQKGKKIRKRFQCTEISTGRIYLFSPVYEVQAV